MKKLIKKPKIIISTYDSPMNPSYGGGGATSIQVISNLLQDKYEITIITGKHEGTQSSVIGGVKYKYIGSNIHPFIDQVFFHLASLYFSITSSCDLWIESYTPPAITGLIPLFSRKRVLGIMHMFPGMLMLKKYHLPFHYIDQIGLKLYKDVVVTTNIFSEKVLAYSPSTNIHIIPNGVDLPARRPSQPKHILYLGRLDISQKGLDTLVKAHQFVHSQVAYPLIIAGPGIKSQVKKLHKLVHSLKLEQSIRFVGQVNKYRKARLLSEAICVVVPSRLETFSIVAAEALFYDVPLVTFDIEGLKWIPKNARFVAKENDISHFAKQVILACTSSQLREKVSKHSQQIRMTLDWKNIAKKYDQIIQRVLHD